MSCVFFRVENGYRILHGNDGGQVNIMDKIIGRWFDVDG